MTAVSTAFFGCFSASSMPNLSGGKSIRISSKPPLISSFSRISTANVRASSTAFDQITPGPVLDDAKVSTNQDLLACPICFEPLIRTGEPNIFADSAPQSSLQCRTCRKAYSNNEIYLDLTITTNSMAESLPFSTEIFRSPLVSLMYERGYRQAFNIWGGFPGPEKEFELMQDYLTPVLGGNIVDASCGSGMFSRLFAKSGLFSQVVALDYSESMLQQCNEFIQLDRNFPKENIKLVRADISRLPFTSSSVDAVHAGAALHCWPSPSTAVTEISRVLRPGGVFVASTYVLDGLLFPLVGPLRQSVTQLTGGHIFLTEDELEDLCTCCGLVSFTCTRNRLFAMIAAEKPN